MDAQESIRKTRAGFEAGFAENNYYNRQTQSSGHLEAILQAIDPDGTILDLGTGSGYLAFALARRNPACHVTGLDIVAQTLERNRREASAQGLQNLDFAGYNGIAFPFPENTFDTIATRYALHHFPDIRETFREIGRVLRPGGQLFIADPAPNGNDSKRFVDVYMQMKDDGHIRYYTQDAFEKLACGIGLVLEQSFVSKIRFPRKNAARYARILSEADPSVLNGYAIEIIGDEIYITQNVLNLAFRKARG